MGGGQWHGLAHRLVVAPETHGPAAVRELDRPQHHRRREFAEELSECRRRERPQLTANGRARQLIADEPRLCGLGVEGDEPVRLRCRGNSGPTRTSVGELTHQWLPAQMRAHHEHLGGLGARPFRPGPAGCRRSRTDPAGDVEHYCVVVGPAHHRDSELC